MGACVWCLGVSGVARLGPARVCVRKGVPGPQPNRNILYFISRVRSLSPARSKFLRRPPLPTRRVRDAVGPSPAAARVERCVYITNPLMVRPNGSPASAIARQRGFRLPLLIKMFSNQSCGNKHMDMLNLLLG